jgi:hypothetical protein
MPACSKEHPPYPDTPKLTLVPGIASALGRPILAWVAARDHAVAPAAAIKAAMNPFFATRYLIRSRKPGTRSVGS